ncbi:MAG: hypothetical protein Q9208_004293 [Pyrenodesmia sp. 3 TL-2023]
MFHRRRASSNPPVKTPPTAAASTAAVQAFLASRGSNADLSSAAAAAALRSRPTTPTPVGDIPTKRRAQRSGSLTSNGSARPTLPRQNSVGSMTERTFRDPSPSRANTTTPYGDDAPPMPPLPKEFASPPPVPTKSTRRPASVEPPERVISPVPRAGGRGVSLDRGPGITQGKQKKKKKATHLDPVGEAERNQSRESVNFSRPMSPQNSPPTSPLKEYKAKPGADQSQYFTPKANMSVLRDGDADNIQYPTQGTADRPVKKKKKAVAKDMEGNHFTGGGGAKPTGTTLVTPSKPPASVSSTPSPSDTRPVASRMAASTQLAPKGKKKRVVSSDSSQGSYASDSDSAISERSSSADRPRAFQTRAAGLLAKQPSIVREDREGEEQEEGGRPAKQNGSITGASFASASEPSRTTRPHKKSTSQPPLLTTAIDSNPLSVPRAQGAKVSQPNTSNLSTEQPRRESLSPGRAAHFLAQPMFETPDGIKHQPPARSVSPAKSALKHSPSSRGASPVGFAANGSNRFSGVAGSEASDNGSVVSDEGGRLRPARKKGARVSFEDDSVVVGRASTPPATDSPTILSPQHKGSASKGFMGFGRRRKGEISPDESDLDEGIEPTPTLPSFGSIRGRKKGEVHTAAQGDGSKSVAQRPLIEAQASSDQFIGQVLAQHHASKAAGSVELSKQVENSKGPIPAEVTSFEGTGYHPDNADSEGDTDIVHKAADFVGVPAAAEVSASASASADEPARSGTTPESAGHAESKTADMRNGSVPSIAILPATPGIGSHEDEQEDWFKMPGGFSTANDDRDVQVESGIVETEAIGSSNPIAAHHVTEPTPADLGISEPEPGSTATSRAGSPMVGHVAEAIEQQTEANNDDESDDTGNSIYSDAAEDISDLEGDGFGSINAIIESPVLPKTPFVAGLIPESPTANSASSGAKTAQPAPVTRNESAFSEPPSDEGWDQAQAYWSGLSQSRKQQLERAAEPGASDADGPSIEATPASITDAKAKNKKAEEKAAPPSDPPLPPWPDREFREEAGRPASRKAGGMKQSMRSSEPEGTQTHMRSSMRNNVPPKSALRNSVLGPESKPAPRGAVPKKDRPMSAMNITVHDKPNGKAAASHGRAASLGVAPKVTAAVVPVPKKTRKPAIQRAASNGSDSSSSFKKSRPSTSEGGKYSMKRTMRGASMEGRPQSAHANRQGSLSARSASPPVRRPFSTASAGSGAGTMRTSMRSSIDSGAGSRAKSPSRAFGFGRSKLKPEAAKKVGSRFSSRFGDSSDEDEAPSKRRSRFVGSSDEEDEKSGLTPVRGIPRRIDEGDSTDLEDSSNSPSPMVRADEKPPMPSTKPLEGSALATGSLRAGVVEQGSGLQAKKNAEKEAEKEKGKKKRSFFGSRSKQQPQPPPNLSLASTNNVDSKVSHPLEANYATPTGTPSTPKSPKAAKFLGNSPLASASASAASPVSQASPKPPKLQRRNTPKRFTSDSWPLPEMPAAAAEKARPSTSDGAAVGKPLAVGSMRPQAGARRFTAEGEPVDGAAPMPSKETGKKKRFPMLRKAFGFIDFDEPGLPISYRDTRECIRHARQQFQSYIDAHGGDGNLQFREYGYNSVVFGVAPVAPVAGPSLKWDDAEAILVAFLLKLNGVGYRSYWARIILTQGGEVVGSAVIHRVPLGRVSKASA